MPSFETSIPRSSWRRFAAKRKQWWPAVMRPGSFERRCGLALLAAGLAIWAWVDVRPRARIDVDRPWDHQTDLTCYTEAGAAFFDGRPPYEVANLRGWGYLYPPLLAMLLAPLHSFDPQTQALIWFGLNIWLAWACMREAEKLAGQCLAPGATPRELQTLLPAISVAARLAVLLPAFNCLQRGQIGIAKLYFLMLGFRLLYEARTWPKAVVGGVSMALAVTLKITPMLPAAFAVGQLAVHARYRPATDFARGRAIGAAAGLGMGLVLFFFVVPSVLVGWNANLRHLDAWTHKVLLKTGDNGGDDFAGNNPHTLRNQSLSNAVYRLGSWIGYEFAGGPDDRRLDEHGYEPGTTIIDAPEARLALGLARLALVLLLLAFGVRMGRRGDFTGQAAGFGLACIATLVVSPLARTHYFVLWLPAVIAAPIWLWRRERRGAALAVAAAPAIITLLHYLLMPTMGRIGLLGIGTACWFLATIWCILATEGKALPPVEAAVSV